MKEQFAARFLYWLECKMHLQLLSHVILMPLQNSVIRGGTGLMLLTAVQRAKRATGRMQWKAEVFEEKMNERSCLANGKTAQIPQNEKSEANSFPRLFNSSYANADKGGGKPKRIVDYLCLAFTSLLPLLLISDTGRPTAFISSFCTPVRINRLATAV